MASLGYLGRDFLKLVLDAGDWVTEDACESFTEPGTDTLLHTVQSDILHLRDRGRDQDCPPLELRPGDDSIQVHCCHSPLREMEVLHDHLLDWFRRDPQLSPHEILVMMPDIEAYAPFIQAVFDSPEDESRRIPFSLADRSARRQSQVIDTFLTLLNLPLTRLGSATVLTLLEAPVVRQRFHLIEQELERIRSWIEETRICWGIDQQHRAQFELPELPNHTWRAGLDRLLLGYALPGRGQHLFAGTLPCDDIEGNAATVLGRFVEFAEQLFATVESLRMARPFGQWQKLLQEVLRRFFHANPQTEPELVEVHAGIDQLARQAALADFQEPLDFAVVLERLTPALESDRFASGFLTGGVTFCALKPMRSIPFKIICLVGMNDEAFPRPTSHLSFDLMARQPRLGDRSSREDDRYLFLETLLSARQRLYLSYVGQSIRDNSQTPPSVLVSELAQYVAQAFTLAPAAPAAGSAGVPLGGSARAPEAEELAGRDASASIVTRHRLQAFSEAYFGGEQPGLFSYSEENCAASQLARRGRAKPRPFLDQPLAEAESEWRHVDLEQ
ncbi:MAG: exodeoxyribonuclease V subunit gamma, partial [Verrucomicrobia bacterium]